MSMDAAREAQTGETNSRAVLTVDLITAARKLRHEGYGFEHIFWQLQVPEQQQLALKQAVRKGWPHCPVPPVVLRFMRGRLEPEVREFMAQLFMHGNMTTYQIADFCGVTQTTAWHVVRDDVPLAHHRRRGHRGEFKKYRYSLGEGVNRRRGSRKADA